MAGHGEGHDPPHIDFIGCNGRGLYDDTERNHRMTIEAITHKAAQAAIPYTVAKEIRRLLDDARTQYGADDWDGDDVETLVIELVTD
jgi:hypothetical protein